MGNPNGYNTPRPVSIRGVSYPSVSSAARDLNISISSIRSAMRNDTLDTVGLYKTHGNPSALDRARVSEEMANDPVWASKVRRTLKQQIVEMYQKGMEPKYIAEELNVSRQVVYNAASAARVDGVSIRNRIRHPETGYKQFMEACRSSGIPRGSYTEIMSSLPAKVISWLVKQVPDGVSAATLVSSIIVDAYHEENDQ